MCTVIIRGNSRVISTSKIKKITAIKKNRSENGHRADPFGSNPHSNGEFFSRSVILFFDNIEEIVISIAVIIIVIKEEYRISRITLLADGKLFGWRPNILYYISKVSSYPISRLIQIKRVKLRQRSVSIMQLLQSLRVVLLKNVNPSSGFCLPLEV